MAERSGRRPGPPAGLTPSAPIRLQVFLARAGCGSRRTMEQAILDGRVAVAGAVVRTLGTKVAAGADVTLDGRPVQPRSDSIVVALHKPPGVLTTVHDPHGRPTVIGMLPPDLRRRRLYPTGRLDRESEGLVLLTDDGALAHRLMHPRFGHTRAYEVTYRGRATPAVVGQFAAGVEIGDRRRARGELSLRTATADGGVADVVLREGRNRQIRRMFAAVGLEVTRLRRTRVASVELADLPPGGTRRLRPEEIQELRA